MASLDKDEQHKKERALPRPGEHVVVHCEGYSCLGYLGKDGTWKSVFTDEKLSRVIDFSPLA